MNHWTYDKVENIAMAYDDLHMTYEGNMLTSVRDNATRLPYSGATDFDGMPGENPLTYNASGSLVSDAGRGIARIDYDRLNNPVRIQFTNGSVTRYIYSAAGEKLRVTHQTVVPNISVAIGSTRELAPSEVLSADSTDYLLGGSLTLRNGRIDKLQFEEGYCQASAYSGNATQDDFSFHYYDRDHLGNIRQVVRADRTTNGTLVQTMDYYPFGAQFCHSSTASEVQLRKYNGKEFDRMHGLDTYDYGARQYDPVTARWDRVDPLSEKYYDVSPYVYCHNNPVMCIDSDGRDWYRTENGTLIWNPKVHSQNDIGKKDADRGYKYVGETYYDKETDTSYRKDGTILYSNEELAYQRMWYLADVHWRSKKYPAGKEEMAYLLSNGKVLIMADNWNLSDKSYSNGYNRKKGILYSQEGESFAYVGQVHTHQMGADIGLSQSDFSEDDDDFAAADPDHPVFVMHKNGNIYAGVFSTKRKGFDNFGNQPIGTIYNLFKGYTSLINSAKIIRSSF